MKTFALFSAFGSRNLHQLAACALLGLVSTVALRADDPKYGYELKPSLLNARDADLRTVAVRFDFHGRQDLNVPTISSAWFADTNGVLALKSRANSEPISAEAGGEFFQRFGGTFVIDQSQKIADPNAAPPPVSPQAAGTHDYLIGLGLKLGLESDQTLENSQFTFGPRVNFTHSENSGLWPLLPSFTIAYQRVRAIRARLLDDNGIPERTFWRLDVAASWKWRPFEVEGVSRESALAPIGLHLDARFYQAYDLPSKAQALGQEEAFYTAGTVSYETKRFNWKYVHDLYVTVAHGRIPPSTRKDTTVCLGVTFVR